MIRLEKVIFSNREPGPQCILIGQPKTSYRTQFDTVMCSAWPPPNRKTDQRVENVESETVIRLQLPKSAHASSCDSMSQFTTCMFSQLMKWKPSLLPFTL